MTCPVEEYQQHNAFNPTFCAVTVVTDPGPLFTMLVGSENRPVKEDLKFEKRVLCFICVSELGLGDMTKILYPDITLFPGRIHITI